jgi:hypothetical protein
MWEIFILFHNKSQIYIYIHTYIYIYVYIYIYTYVHMYHIFFIYSSINEHLGWVASTFFTIVNMLLWIWIGKYLSKTLFSIPLAVHPEVRLLHQMVIQILPLIMRTDFNFLRTVHMCSCNCTILHSSQQCVNVPLSPHPWSLMSFWLLFHANPNGCRAVGPHWSFHLHLSWLVMLRSCHACQPFLCIFIFIIFREVFFQTVKVVKIKTGHFCWL